MRKFYKKLSNALVLLLLLTSTVWAQERSVSGVVTDENGVSMPGVNVLLKGTSTGTVTDTDGNFRISVPNEQAVLVFSFVGYSMSEVTVGSRTSINVQMNPDAKTLSEVVVVGYGVQEKKDLTGAISTVNAQELRSLPLLSTEQALQGRTSGVLVTQNSGAPGGAINVQIRGVGTTGNSEPLYVIDGVIISPPGAGQLSSSPLNAINPGDIETLTVLKDASAAAIYGASAANGVVLITTKRGKSGAVKVEADAYYGVQQVWNTLDLLNSREHSQYIVDAYLNSGKTLNDVPLNHRNPSAVTTDTDWQDEMFRTAPIQNYNVSVSGGSEKATFSLSGNWFQQDGILLGTNFDRKSIRMNSDFKLGKNNKVRVGESFTLAKTVSRREGTYGGRRQLEHIVKQGPGVAVYNENYLGGFNGPGTADGHDAENPVAVAAMYTNRPTDYRVLGNFYGEVDLIKNLTFRTSVGMDYTFSDGYEHNIANQMVRGLLNRSRLGVSRSISANPIWSNTLNYNRNFGDHRIEALAGYERRSSSWSFLSTAVLDLPNDAVRSISAGQQPNVGGGTFENALASAFGRVNYSYKDKYLATVNFRRDGSSRLLNRYQSYPSFSVGWRISEENFMQDVELISDLKVRAGYGEIGNVFTASDYGFAVELISSANYNFNGSLVPGVTQTRLPNPDLRWESTNTTNVGIDLGLFDDQLTFTAEWYKRVTEGLQYRNPDNRVSSGLNSNDINLGEVTNTGMDFALNYRKQADRLSYNIGINASTLKNELSFLGSGEGNNYSAGNTFSLGNLTRTEVGQPLGSFYGWVTDGIFQTQAEVDAHATQSAQTAPGDIRFKDLDGNGVINALDRADLGSPIPTFFYGMNASVNYGQFDFSLFLQGVSGHKVFNALRTWTEDLSQNFNQGKAALDRWTPENRDTNVPRAINGDPNNNKRASDRFVEDGGFMRLKNLSVGYSLTPSLVNKLSLQRVRVYATAQNLFTITKYTGFDPEIGSQNGSSTERGIDIGVYPQARTIILGVQVGL